jgi:lipopolysaccharide biosynthesis glycosyltransferase/glycosyltransferase involved in cell wall biosynthesis
MGQNEQKAMLDIIITHYNEPWEVGKKLFDSIMLQECVQYENVNIILVQDGKETELPWKDLLGQYPFRVSVVTMKEHHGVADARNVGMDHAVTDWIMFMDFDDMFADIAALSMLVRLFPVGDDVDVIWSKYVREVVSYSRFKGTAFNCEDEHDYRMIGNIYRRQFLIDHKIRFANNCPEYCDMIFNSIVFAETYAFRIKNFFAPFYPFYKKLRRDGAFSTIDTLNDKAAHQFERNLMLMAEMKNRNKIPQYNVWLIRTLADAYHVIRSVDYEPDDRYGITDELIMFWAACKDRFLSLSQYDIEVALDDSQTEAMTFIQEYYNYFDKEYYMQNDMISFQDFIAFLDRLATPVTNPVAQEAQPAPQEDNVVQLQPAGNQYGKRAVVYCGTKETYINMIASVKSLLATTHVDKVYFLIEDDTFPYEIPDIIETRNVKNTGLFDPDGPNFQNAWTYMCLMRTAYPQMFPQYDKVLSLDIDVVITEDIGCLWDIDLTDYYFAGVAEEGRSTGGPRDIYANFGVIMMNLDKLRRDGLGNKLIEAVNTEKFGCPEQDAFNKLCRGHIYQLPNDYNVTVYSHITGEPLQERVLHYAGLKYWKHFRPVKKYFNLSWDEIMKLQERAGHE